MPKTRKSFEKHILSVIRRYMPVLLLQRHTFEVKLGVEKKTSFMECVFNYPYLNVTIHYSKEAFDAWKKGKDMVPYIVHEMCHPITDPLYAKAVTQFVSKSEIEDERERLTDLICNIALRATKHYRNNKGD